MLKNELGSRTKAQLAGTALGAVLVFGGYIGVAQAQTTSDEIVVTGSLIARPNNASVSPIQTVDAAAIAQTGTGTLQDALNQVPSFTVGGNATTGGQGSGGRATINLHGLGTNRNLVLLDGKRLPVSDINGNVDVNILPQAIISGVDAITGGASAVYGSDAMSGVVNFKTLRSFDGVRLDVMNSRSAEGDANQLNASIAMGSGFAEDRGHVIATLGYAKQDPVANLTRSFFFDKVPSSFIGSGTFIPSATNAPDGAVLAALFNSYGVPGTRNPLASNLGFNDDGTLFTQSGALNYKGPNGTGGYAVPGGNVRMPVGQQGNMINGMDRKTAFLKADYDVTSNINLYGQFMFVDLSVNTNSGGSLTQFPTLTTIPVTNPFIPAALKTVLASRPTAAAPFAWNARYVGIPWKNWDEDYTVQQYLAGVKGDIMEGWSYDGFVSYDESVHDSVMHFAVLKSRVQALLNATDGGNSICAGGFNPFGDANANRLSPACVNYMTKDAISKEKLTQTQVQGQINGTLFDLGAGPAQVAFLGAWRENTYKYSPDSDVTALSGWAPGGNVEGFVATIAVPEQQISVKEFAAQVDVPLIADKTFVKELAIGAAARVSDYSETGSVNSYEADARWRPIDNLMLRGSYQRAVRAPNIGELFAPPSGVQLAIGTPPASIGDPCDVRGSARTGANGAQVAALCVTQGVPSAVIPTYQFATTAIGQTVAGNRSVTPEKADTFNLGAVFNSPAEDGVFGDFNVSLDYYKIEIEDVITTVPGLTVLSKCYNLDGTNPTYSNANPYCALVQRDTGTGQLLQVNTPYQNLGVLRTDGVEAQIHWGVPAPLLSASGKAYVDTSIGWLNKYEVQILPGGPFIDYTGISIGGTTPGSVPPRAAPEWKALTTFGYAADRFGFGLRWRYQASLKDVSSVLTPNNVAVGVKAYNLFDLFGSFKVTEGIELRGGINNIADRELPFVASSQNGTDTALYDGIGRAFYVGVRASF